MRGTVVLTASAGSFPGLAERLRALPVAVEERPLMRFAPPPDWGPVDAAIDAALAGGPDRGGYAAIAFTSPRAPRAFAARMRDRGLRWPPRGSRPEVWAAGAGTAQALGNELGDVRTPHEDDVGRHGAAAALAQAMLAAGVGGPVLFPCGDRRRDELPVRLRRDGLQVDDIVCYRSVLATEAEARAAADRATVLVVASPSVAELLASACPPESRPALLAVGPSTAAASRASGWPAAAVAQHPTAEAVGAAAQSLLGNHSSYE